MGTTCTGCSQRRLLAGKTTVLCRDSSLDELRDSGHSESHLGGGKVAVREAWLVGEVGDHAGEEAVRGGAPRRGRPVALPARSCGQKRGKNIVKLPQPNARTAERLDGGEFLRRRL